MSSILNRINQNMIIWKRTIIEGIIMKYLSFILILLPCQVALSQEIAYPLAIGDRWMYSVEGITAKTVEITGDTVMSNGKQYQVLTGLDEQFQRFEDNKVFVYDPNIESERLQYDFTVAPGDTILTYVLGQDTADIVFLYFENTFTYGAWRQRFWFNYEIRHETDLGWSNAITDSIGLDVHTAFAGWFYSILYEKLRLSVHPFLTQIYL